MKRKYTDEDLKRMFTQIVTDYVAKHISKKQHISYAVAKKNFKQSKTYAYLNSDEPFPEEGPEDFLDWYQNEQKYGKIISSTTLYFEKKYPDVYEKALAEGKVIKVKE